jgi:hypothetical protein
MAYCVDLSSSELRTVHALRAARLGSLLAVALAIGCTAVTAAPAGPGGPWDSGVGPDTGADVVQPVDASACQPGDLRTFHPDGYHPASGAWQGVCPVDGFNDAIQGFFASCLSTLATTDLCSAFRTQYATCFDCILTPESAATYGPIIDHGGFVTGNVAGCIELSGTADTGAGDLPCAEAVQARTGCELAACQANCPVHDAASLASYDTCADQADKGGCQSYLAAASCEDGVADAGGPATDCLLQDFKSFYDAVVPRFCGKAAPAGGDAGADSGGPLDASGQ